MNEKLREYLRSINVRVVNPIRASIKKDSDIVGWHCVSGVLVRMDKEIMNIKAFISDNKIPYSIVSTDDNTKSFFIYK